MRFQMVTQRMAPNSEDRDTVDMSESVSADMGMVGSSDTGLADCPDLDGRRHGNRRYGDTQPHKLLDDAEDGPCSRSQTEPASGNQVPMCEYEGNAILFVNTAANCGLRRNTHN